MKTQLYLLFITVILILNTSCQNQEKEKELMSVEKIYIAVYYFYPVDLYEFDFHEAIESHDKLDSYYRNKIWIRGYMEVNKDYSFKILSGNYDSFMKLKFSPDAYIYTNDSLKNRMNQIIALYPTDTILPYTSEELMIHSSPSYMIVIEKNKGEYIHVMSEIPGSISSDIDLFDYEKMIFEYSHQYGLPRSHDSILQTIDFLKYQIPFEFLDKSQGFPTERLKQEKHN